MSKKRDKNNNSIKCDVDSCKYNDNEEGKCELEQIQVGHSEDISNDEVSESSDTICESFESSDDNLESEKITDNVYDVNSETEEVDE